MLGTCSDMESSEEGLKRTNVHVCRIAYPHVEVGRLDLISNDLVINCNILIKDSARPFVLWIYGNKCSNCIPVDSQYVLNA